MRPLHSRCHLGRCLALACLLIGTHVHVRQPGAVPCQMLSQGWAWGMRQRSELASRWRRLTGTGETPGRPPHQALGQGKLPLQGSCCGCCQSPCCQWSCASRLFGSCITYSVLIMCDPAFSVGLRCHIEQRNMYLVLQMEAMHQPLTEFSHGNSL